MKKYILVLLFASTAQAQFAPQPWPLYPNGTVPQWNQPLFVPPPSPAIDAYHREAAAQMMVPPSSDPIINYGRENMRGQARQNLLNAENVNRAAEWLRNNQR